MVGKGRSRPSAEAAARQVASVLPVARVAVDSPLPHLDRAFDYLVSEAQSQDCVVGCRVRVRFAGRLVGGFVLDRVARSEHEGRLAFLERVVSAEVVLTAEVARLARAAADRWAGSFADVTRLAVPPRHAAQEQRESQTPSEPDLPVPEPSRWSSYDGGAALLDRVGRDLIRAVVEVLPGDWPALLADLAAATVARGRGAVVVVPDHRDVARVGAALDVALGADRYVALAADLGPAERYRRFLAVARGGVRCVVGTRAAVWAPVHDLGLVIVWDDGDDLHAEPRAPYCHARDVAVMRAHLAQSSCVVAGFAVTAESALLLETRWARLVRPTEQARGSSLPTVRAADDDLGRDAAAKAARLPSAAWQVARDALSAGRPVLVQVPRLGYHLTLQCASCRLPARCDTCSGPLQRTDGDASPRCGWCGTAAVQWRCPSCSATRLRAGVVGAARTAEELGRAFPGAVVRTSGGDTVLADVDDGATLVVATPGAEPMTRHGYGAALLLDAWSLLGRPDLRASEEALRRWINAAALVRPATAGGRVVVVAAGELRAVQALLRWRPDWHAQRELEDRQVLHLPPAARMAALTGPPGAVQELLELADLPQVAEVLGPVPAPRRAGDTEVVERVLVRVPRRDGAQLAAALHAAAAIRSARKSAGSVRVEVDPATIG